MVNAVQDIDKFAADNKELIEQYIAYKKSDEYRNSFVCKLQLLLQEFNSSSDYYEIFIKNMKKLSPQYEQYHAKVGDCKQDFIFSIPGYN